MQLDTLSKPYVLLVVSKAIFIIFAGAFYFHLGNINPKLRSKVSSIQLVCIAKFSVIDEFGIDSVATIH